MTYFEALSGGLSHYLPLLLRLRAKTIPQSYRTPGYFVDLTLRDGDDLAKVVAQAKVEAEQALEAGIDSVQLEAVANSCCRTVNLKTPRRRCHNCWKSSIRKRR